MPSIPRRAGGRPSRGPRRHAGRRNQGAALHHERRQSGALEGSMCGFSIAWLSRRAIHRSFSQRLAKELRIWAGLDHPNVLELLGFCIEPDLTGTKLIAPWLDNGHVAAYIKTVQPTKLHRLLLVSHDRPTSTDILIKTFYIGCWSYARSGIPSFLRYHAR